MMVAINDRQWAGLVTALALAVDMAALEARVGRQLRAMDDGRASLTAMRCSPLIERAIAALDSCRTGRARSMRSGVVHSALSDHARRRCRIPGW